MSARRPVSVLLAGAEGRMGRMCQVAFRAAPDIKLTATLVRGDDPDVAVDWASVDVLVDFTEIGASRELVPLALERGVRPVVGTSGWSTDDLLRLAELCRRHASAALVVPNFSVGAVLQMELSARIAAQLPCTAIHERHHAGKRDAPSGTARATADAIEAVSGRRPSITSERLPGATARQEICFGTGSESLTLVHEVTDRAAYAPGLILAVTAVGGLDGLVVGLAPLLL